MGSSLMILLRTWWTSSLQCRHHGRIRTVQPKCTINQWGRQQWGLYWVNRKLSTSTKNGLNYYVSTLSKYTCSSDAEISSHLHVMLSFFSSIIDNYSERRQSCEQTPSDASDQILLAVTVLCSIGNQLKLRGIYWSECWCPHRVVSIICSP